MTLLTVQEKKVVLFLVGTLVLGTGIKFYKQHYAYHEFTPVSIEEKESFKDLATAVYDAANQKHQKPKSITSSSEEKNYQPNSEIININTAGKQDLVKLPKVGPVTAERIIRFREDFGPFNTVDDLMKIKGIGPKTLEKIKPKISLK